MNISSDNRYNIPVTVIRSNRKTLAICIKEDLSVTVRAPRRASKTEIERILKEKDQWIQKHISLMKGKNSRLDEIKENLLTDAELKELKAKAKRIIPERAAAFSKIIGVDYGRISIRSQKTIWGSCSSKGNLNFNCLLMLAPPEVIDYVVVHELCHRKEMNHSKAFWHEVEKVIPNYKIYLRWLKDEGGLIMRRLN